ncbi:MAG: PQQ-dependent sugar dehydrogenase [Myxococcales bacterium]|nr:PQQ-dependent sugar dehydrogenase [Myxococcales bacterium]
MKLRAALSIGTSVTLALLGACAEDEALGPEGGNSPVGESTSDGSVSSSEGGSGSTDGGSDLDGTVSPDATADATAGADALADAKTDAKADAKLDAKVDAPVADAGCTPPVIPALRILDVSSQTFGSTYFAAQAPGSPNDWYLVEQNGMVRIVRNGTPLATPFLDLGAAMGNGFGERGLLSIAFHPSYANNGRFFVMGTPATSSNGSFAPENADAVVEFARDPGNADVALPTKVQDIVVLPASDTNHNGGAIAFGPGGFLFVATGDGGGGCESDQSGAVQNTSSLFGKMLRLDVNASAPFAAAGNPFAAGGDARVYHYGLRNPFRWNFDGNDLYIGDVGQNAYEEISVVLGNGAGKNFGWPAFEGSVGGTCAGKTLGGPAPHTPPIVTVDRRGGSTSPFADYNSVIGGRVYRGTAMPTLAGVYFFADFTGGAMGAVRNCSGTFSAPAVIQLSQVPTPTGTLATISSFAQGLDGELYVTYNSGTTRLGRLALQ